MEIMETFLLDDSWENITEIIPFGYGRVGRRVIKKLSELFEIPFTIDNNPQWQSENAGVIIKTLQDAKGEIGCRKIVVLTTDLPYLSIKNDLIKEGFEEYKDFCVLSRFLGEWYLKYRNELYISKVDTIITSRCTLNCPHCAMYISRCDNKVDYPLEKLCRNFDVVFSNIDFIMEYSLFGGEPLIYGKLPELIEYLMDNYGDRIGRLVLISNGKAVVDNRLLETLSKYKVFISISSYVDKYDYGKIQNQLVKQFERYDVEYSFNQELVWKDMGYPDNPANVPDQLARAHFRNCGHSTFCINDGILYYCDAMFGAEANTSFVNPEKDIIRIVQYQNMNGNKKTKMRIFQYIMGNINELGCPKFCQLCKGVGSDNSDYIIAGE